MSYPKMERGMAWQLSAQCSVNVAIGDTSTYMLTDIMSHVMLVYLKTDMK